MSKISAAGNQFRLRHKKNAAQVGAALVRTKARLTQGRFSPLERPSRKSELPFRSPPAQLAHRRLGKQFRMVETALFSLRWMERNRNH